MTKITKAYLIEISKNTELVRSNKEKLEKENAERVALMTTKIVELEFAKIEKMLEFHASLGYKQISFIANATYITYKAFPYPWDSFDDEVWKIVRERLEHECDLELIELESSPSKSFSQRKFKILW